MRRPTLLLTAAALLLTGCGASSTGAPSSAATPRAATPRAATSGSPGVDLLVPRPTAPASSSAPTSEPTSAAAPAPSSAPSSAPSDGSPGSCAALVQTMTPQQRVGQLLMIGLDSGWSIDHDDATIAAHHVGGVFYLGGWDAARVRRASDHLASLDGEVPAGGDRVRLMVAADQEGGQVRQVRSGVTRLPSASVQGTRSPERITDDARTVGRELASLGVSLDLAPVADTVPPGTGRANDPIGRWGRQFGTDPQTAARGAEAFTRGLRQAGIGATVKHFPGLGRVRGNTDFTSRGIDDTVADADDPYLEPFRRGIAAGAAVMMSSARYPRLDDANQAVFSRAIVTGLLRERLGYQGLVMTDDMGSAKAVAAVPAGERAVRFVDAGGDLVLTGRPTDAGPMARALLARRDADPAFAARVDESATRVLAYKAGLGLARCS